MTTLDTVMYQLKKHTKVIFAIQKDPSTILAVIPEKSFFNLIEKYPIDRLKFQYLEKRKNWFDIHMVMHNNSISSYITFRIHNPTEEISTRLTTKYPSSSAFV